MIALLNRLSVEMINSLLPLFLVLSLGVGPMALGLIEGAGLAIYYITRGPFGFFSDRLKRHREFVITGYLVSNLLRPWMGVFLAWTPLLMIRGLDYLGQGLCNVPLKHFRHRGEAHKEGYELAGGLIGSGLVALLLYLYPQRLREIFFVAALPLFLMTPLLFRLKEPQDKEATADVSIHITQGLPETVRYFLKVRFLFHLGNPINLFLLLRLHEAKLPLLTLPLFWGALQLIQFGSQRVLHPLLKSWKNTTRLRVGWLYYGILLGAIAWVDSQVLIIILVLASEISFGILKNADRALLSKWTAPSQQQSIALFESMLTGLALLLANVIFGILWQVWGLEVAFTFSASVVLLATLFGNFK